MGMVPGYKEKARYVLMGPYFTVLEDAIQVDSTSWVMISMVGFYNNSFHYNTLNCDPLIPDIRKFP